MDVHLLSAEDLLYIIVAASAGVVLVAAIVGVVICCVAKQNATVCVVGLLSERVVLHTNSLGQNRGCAQSSWHSSPAFGSIVKRVAADSFTICCRRQVTVARLNRWALLVHIQWRYDERFFVCLWMVLGFGGF